VVIIGGERALAARVEEWRRRVAGDSRLVNTYGPTEATVVATRADVGGGSGEAAPPGEVSMGRPISNLRALVLDARGRELPVGVPG
jgi:non-ribosomal peptide synthetase component F